MAMSKEKLVVIQDNFTKLTENIGDIDRVVSNLVAARVITEYMEEEIMSKNTSRNKIRELLTIIPKHGESAFDGFYKALIDSEETVAAGLIEAHVSDRSLIGYNSSNDNQVQVLQPHDNRKVSAVFPPDPQIDHHVVTCVRTDQAMFDKYKKSLELNNEFYKNKNGKCLLYYNENFDETSLTDLDWEKDAMDLSKLFEELGFEVKAHNNMTILEFQTNLDKHRKNMKDIDCLVVFVLTHGENGQVYGTDGNSMNMQSIIDYFYPAKCPDLSSKPKLFFIQTASTVRELLDSADGGSNTVEISLKTAVDNLNIGEPEKNDAVGESRNEASRGHTYMCVSTTSDKLYPNESESGSLFIQALIHAYQYNAFSSDLDTLTRKMNDLIKGEEIKHNRPTTIGSHTKSSLVKSLYFFPGKFDTKNQ